MFELRVALRRDSGLLSRPQWVGWAPLCPALAAEDGFVVWVRPGTPAADVDALRDCALYEEKWNAMRRTSARRGSEVVRLDGAHGPLAVSRRQPRRFRLGRASRAEREARAMAERETLQPDAAVRTVGWAEERRRGRVVREYIGVRSLDLDTLSSASIW